MHLSLRFHGPDPYEQIKSPYAHTFVSHGRRHSLWLARSTDLRARCLPARAEVVETTICLQRFRLALGFEGIVVGSRGYQSAKGLLHSMRKIHTATHHIRLHTRPTGS